MKITTVRYRRLQSHERGYGHDAVEAEAQVEKGEDPNAALEELKAWVGHRLDGMREIDRHLDTLDSLRNRVVSEERRVKQLRERVDQGRALAAKYDKLADLAREHGIDIGDDANLLGEVPF